MPPKKITKLQNKELEEKLSESSVNGAEKTEEMKEDFSSAYDGDDEIVFDGLITQAQVQLVISIIRMRDGRPRIVGSLPVNHNMSGDDYMDWEPDPERDIEKAVEAWIEQTRPDKETRQRRRDAERRAEKLQGKRKHR